MDRTQASIAASFALALVASAGHAAQATDPAAGAPQPLQVAASAPGQDQNYYQPTPRIVTAENAPPAQIQALAEGSNKLVTNGPIPDTPANRKLYGKPLSHAGRKSAPDGN